MRHRLVLLCLSLLLPQSMMTPPLHAAEPNIFGTVASSPVIAKQMVANGITLASYGIIWQRLEPKQGQLDPTYIAKVKADLQTFKQAGMQVSLDVGMQYPPHWAYKIANALFINQYGETFDPTTTPGSNGLNAVFNQAIRDAQATHLKHIFEQFGTDFRAVRLGWGYYGELNYPHPNNRSKKNCYWAFDPIAQGKVDGLPATLKSCPVPGYHPGEPSIAHDKARQFIRWYLQALKDYHDWQITTTRQFYDGDLAMMMGSWGLRFGELDKLINADLADDGRTEAQRGFDFARYIAGVTDPRYIVYCTWLDTPEQYCDDANRDPARWSPVHYLAFAAQRNPLKLRIWAENTGRGSVQDMQLCFRRAKAFGVQAIVWAFEEDLFNDKYATLKQYQSLINEYQSTSPQP